MSLYYDFLFVCTQVKIMTSSHASLTTEYCPGETVTLYSQQHHARIHLQTHTHANNHIPMNQSKITTYI